MNAPAVDHDAYLIRLGAQAAVAQVMAVPQQAGSLDPQMLAAAQAHLESEKARAKLDTALDPAQRTGILNQMESMLAGLRALKQFRDVLAKIDDATTARSEVIL